ncbi:MAG: Ig-like domain-containing protein [Myxococcota bacterium]|nr:Ig-like domain-containing protein [Myxococcota bacterium]
MANPNSFVSTHWAICAVAAFAVACQQDTKIGIRHEPPSVQIIEPSNESTHDSFATVRFVAQVETYDGSDLTTIQHTWVTGSDVACDWEAVPSDGMAVCSMSFEEPGPHTVTVTVKNERLDTATSTISVNIGGNDSPTINITSPEDGAFYTPGEVVTLEATVSDGEDSPDTLTVVGLSSLDSDLGLTATPTSSGAWSTSLDGLSPGTHFITLTVYDTTGLSDQDTVGVVINESPSAPAVEISPDPAISGTQLTATITAESVDPEGDPIVYDYQWYVNGIASPGATTPVVPAGTTRRDDFWEIRVTASDPRSSSDPGVASITIGNSLPRVDAVVIIPEAPVTLDDLTAVPTGWFDQDLDPESYEYQWSVDGVVDSDETTDTFPWEKSARGNQVRVTITPTDGFGAGEPVTSTITTIENSAPTGGGATIDPEVAEPTDTLFCLVDVASADADGDPIEYRYVWSLGGSEMPGLTASSVPPLETSDGDVWTCEVIPSDGTDEGPGFTASVAVTDGTAPPPPDINPLTAHRNKDFATLTGTCEAGCALDFYCDDSTTSWVLTDTCTSTGTFSVTVDPLTRGDITSCFGTCTDPAGNVSGDSLAVTTEVCDPEDVYENGAYGDLIDDPVDEWPVLNDDGTTTVSIIGNVLEEDDEDWYVISAGDDVSADIAAGRDMFKFDVEFSEDTSGYRLVVYRDSPTSTETDSCLPTGYTEYSWYYETRDDGEFRGMPTDLQSCDGGSISKNTCEDLSADFLIQVFRESTTPVSCDGYQLQITNGVW